MVMIRRYPTFNLTISITNFLGYGLNFGWKAYRLRELFTLKYYSYEYPNLENGQRIRGQTGSFLGFFYHWWKTADHERRYYPNPKEDRRLIQVRREIQ